MAVGQIIGRVSVKVMPNTKDFRKEAQRDLDRIEKSLRAEAKVTFNKAQIKVEALKALRDLNSTLKDDRYKVQFQAAISKTGMTNEVRRAASDLEARAKTQKVRFNVDVAAAVVNAELDRNSLDFVKRELERFRDDNSPLKIGVKPEIITGTPALVSARLSLLTRPRFVPIVPVLDEGAAAKVATLISALAGGRVLNDVFDNLWQSLKRLDKSVPAIGSIAFAILGLGGYALTAGSNLFALSSSLAQIGPAALALPGIFAGMAIGLGATVAVLKDFGDYLPEVKGKFTDLQDVMSVNFWTIAEEPIRRFINTLFPQFAAGMAEVSTGLGTFFSNLSKSASGQFDGALAGMFDDLTKSVDIAGRRTDAYTQIVRVLGEVGAGYLPRLARFFGDISRQFAIFLGQAQADGSLSRWIDNGIFLMTELGRVIKNAATALAGIAEAATAAGGSGLTQLADGLQQVSDVTNGDAFQGNLTKVLLAAHYAMQLIADQSGPAVTDFFTAFASTLETTLPIVGRTIGKLGEALFSALADPAVQAGFTQMVAGIAVGVNGLLPAFAAIAPAFGAVMEVVGALAQNLGPLLNAAFSSLGPALAVVGAALIPVINMLGPILTSIVTALGPVIALIAAKFAEVAVAAQPLIERFGELVAFVMPILVPALKFLVDVIGDALISAINGAIQVFDGIKTVISGFTTIISGVIAIFNGDFKQGFAMVWQGVKAIFTGAFNVIVGALKVWLNVGILSFVKGGVTKLLGLWKGGWSAIKGALSTVWNGIKTVVTAGFNAVRGFISGGINAVKGLWSGGWNAIKAVLSNVWNAIKSVVTSAFGAVRGAVSSGMSTVKSVWTNGWNAVKTILSNAWTAIKTAVTKGVDAAITTVKTIGSKAGTAIGSAATAISNAAKDAFAGIVDAASNAVDSALDKVKSLAGKFNPANLLKRGFSVVNPGNLDAAGQKFFNAGNDLMAELGKGSQAGIEKVGDLIGKFTSAIPEKASASLKDLLSVNAERMTAEIKQWESHLAKLGKANDEYQALLNESRNYAESVRKSMVNGIGDIARTEDQSFGGIIAQLKTARSLARDFRDTIQALIKKGLAPAAVDQLVQAGPETALAAAQAVLAAGEAGITQINALQLDISNAAQSLGLAASDALFGTDLDIAKALLDSLEGGKGALVEAVAAIGSEMMLALTNAFNSGTALDVAAPAASGGGGKGKGGKNKNKNNSQKNNIENAGKNANKGNRQDGNGGGRTLVYNAARGSSLNSEDDLFRAADRGRMWGW